MKKKIAIVTGGGDCPGLNAVIHFVSSTSLGYRTKVPYSSLSNP